MARNGAGVYSLPAGSTVTNGDTSDSTDLNTPLTDLETDANTARPIVAGGTGATSASAARTNLGVGDASAVTHASLTLDSTLPVLTLDDSNTATTHNKVAVQYNAEQFRVQLRDDTATAVASLFDADADSAGWNTLTIATDVSQVFEVAGSTQMTLTDGILNMNAGDVRNVSRIEFNGASAQDYISWTTAVGMNFFENNVRRAQLGSDGLRLLNSDGTTEGLHISGSSSKITYDTPTEHEFQIGGTRVFELTGSGSGILGVTDIRPVTDNAFSCGGPVNRFDNVWAVSGVVSTSDANEKHDIAELFDKERQLGQILKGLIRTYRWNHRPDKKYVGVIAQEVIAAFDTVGLDWQDYGVIYGGPGGGDDGEDVPYGVDYNGILALVVGAL